MAVRGRALVTGASSGIGAAYAEALARTGYDLVLVARREDRLRTLGGMLSNRFGIQADVIPVDLATEPGMEVVETVLRVDPGVDLLVNNAGFGAYMPFTELPARRRDELLTVQVVAPTRFAQSALGPMLARGRGTIVNVASLVAFSGAIPPSPLPHRAVYGATKAYLVTFTLLLNNELKDRGIRFQVLCPGVVATEFHTIQGRDVSYLPSVTSEQVVAASLIGLERGEVVCIPTAGDDQAIEGWIQASNALFGAASRPIAERYRPDLS